MKLTRDVTLVTLLLAMPSAYAAEEIPRLTPDNFTGLPPHIQHALSNQGCTVPQDFEAKRPMNVIRGRFISQTRKDFALLCSRGGRSAILVIHARTGRPLAAIAAADDLNYVQTVNGGSKFSRRISRVQPGLLARSAAASEQGKPERWREGIDDYFVEKASTVHYWHRGSWRRAAGAD